jgi:hypothetical protein
MLKLENPINFNNSDKTDNKKQYLSIIRDLTSQGKYFSLINFIDKTTPNVSIYLYYLILFIIVLFYISENIILYL